MDISNYRLTLSYDGTRYFGFQKTRMGPSVAHTLETALKTLLQHPISCEGASRTDRGVHAKGQVVNFFTKERIHPNSFIKKMNQLLPLDVQVKEIKKELIPFHPSLDAKRKEYRYFVCNTPFQLPFHKSSSWHVPLPLDLNKMQKGAELLMGTHDFSAFCDDTRSDKIRKVEKILILERSGNRICFTIVAERFLYKMVRSLVGTLIHIGRSKLQIEDIPLIFESKDRKSAGETAPAKGLFLQRVFY